MTTATEAGPAGEVTVPTVLRLPASVACRAGRDGIADQGGWARHSRSVLGYVQIDDGWDDNAASLT
jgi:hypothetical protein